MGDIMAYQCEWERDDNPTRGMGSTEMSKYYKAHAMAGDLAFYLHASESWPRQIRAHLEAFASETAGRKQTPALKRELRLIVDAWRQASFYRETSRRQEARMRLERMRAKFLLPADMKAVA